MKPGRTLFAASLGFFVVVLDTTIVNLALPSIGEELDAGLSGLQWVVDSYVVVFAGLLLSSGSLADRIGPARCFRLGMLAFGLASLACALAPSLEVLLGARVAQGATAALLLPSSLALVRHAYDTPEKRTRAVTTWAAIAGIALAAGPLLGGILTDAIDWRAVFLVNVPVALVAVGAAAGARSLRHHDPLDLPGQLAAIVAIGALTFAVIEAGHEGVGSSPALGAFAVALASAAAFVAIELRSAHPALPPELFRNPTTSGATAVGLIFNFAFYGQLFVLGLFFQEVLGHSPLEAGLMFLPMTALIAAVNLVSGRLAVSRGVRAPILAGALVMAVGLAGLSFVDAGTPTWLILAATVPVGIGGGLAVPPLTAALLESAPPRYAGLASGGFNAARQFGGGLGVAVFGGLLAGDFLDGMQVSLLLAAAGALACFALAAAYVRPPEPEASG